MLSQESLLGSTKKDADKDKDREDVPKLESVEVVLDFPSLCIEYISISLSFNHFLKELL